MRRAIENRSFISFLLAAAIGMTLFFQRPFPVDDTVVQLIRAQRPAIFEETKWTYTAMLFTTPYIALSLLLSVTYIFVMKQDKNGNFLWARSQAAQGQERAPPPGAAAPGA